jgi:protein-S-isoprenylcysteine O-methyltransferase Ste14
MRTTFFLEPLAARVGRVIYPARGAFGVPFMLGVLLLCRPQPFPVGALEAIRMLIGWSILVTGLVVRTWGVACWFTRDQDGVIGGKRLMIDDGPYLYCRNPRYLGNLLMGLGASSLAGMPQVVAWYALLWLAVHIPVMAAERESLEERFAERYAAYCERVPMLVPRLEAEYPLVPQFLGVNWAAGMVEEIGTWSGWLAIALFVEWWRAAHVTHALLGRHVIYLMLMPLVVVAFQRLRGILKAEQFDKEDRPLAP